MPTDPVTPRCRVLDVPSELSAALSDLPGLVLRPDATAECDAVIRLYPPAPSRVHDQQRICDVRLEAISCAPVRYNGVVIGDVTSTVELVRYLAGASAVTGQLLAASPAPTPPERTA